MSSFSLPKLMNTSTFGQYPGRYTNSAGLFLAVFLLSTFAAFGQNSTGSLKGTVTDPTGAVIPKAKVILTNEATNVTRDTVSNDSGFFNFAAVQPATYSVTISANGFQSWEEKDIAFTQAANVTLPSIVLQVGNSKQQIEVISAAELPVPTDTGQVSQTLNEHMITELAIQGRDAAELIKIMPGMGMNTGLGNSMWSSLTTQSNSGPIGAFSAGGTQPNGGMTMTLDGANLLDPGNQGTQTSNVNQNQTAEVTILTSAYGAEFAKGPVTFQAIGKSGGDHFHGGAYFYARNGIFSSEDSFLKNQGVAKPNDSYYYPGGDIGGPVIIPHTNFNRNHDKLFFYAAYENMRQNPEGSLLSRFIPTQTMMNGNFSQSYLNTLGSGFANTFGSAATAPCATSCTGNPNGLPGGMIPVSQLDPNSQALYKLMPQPNANPATTGGYNYQYLNQLPVDRWELRLRGDYNINESTKLFFSYTKQDETDLNPISVWWYAGNSIPYPSAMPAYQVSQVYSANLTHSFSPTLTNEFVFADATFINPIGLTNPAAVNPAKVGFNMTGLFTNGFTPQIPNTTSWSGTVPGYLAPTFGQKWQSGDFGKLSQAPNMSDNITKVAGTHTLKAGFYWDFARNQQTASNYTGNPQGTLDYENYGYNTSGNALADFAMARITGFTQANDAQVQDFKYYQYSFFLNDQWKASRRLTLTLGVRFDHMGQWVPSGKEGLAVWDPAQYNATCTNCAFTGLLWHGINTSIPLSGFPSKPFFIEPRFGVAYDVFGNGKTVLRGGFGVYRYQLSYNTASEGFNAPAAVVTESTTWNCCIGYNSFNQFSPTLGAAGLGSSINALQMGDSKTPYTESYNFTISQRTPWNSVAEFQYSGNQSHDLLGDSALTNQDLIPLGTFFKPDPLTGQIVSPTASNFNANDYYPFHQYTGIQLVEHNNYQYYNAFIATWQKQTGKTTFTTNYTFSKVLGIRDGNSGNGGGNGSLLDPFSNSANYGVLAYDHSQIFNAAYVVNLPKPIHDNKLLGGVVNGWEFSGITQLQSGAPIQPNTGGNLNVQLPGGSQYSNSAQLGTNSMNINPFLTCDPRSGLKSGQYFNTSCFTLPTGGNPGNIIWPYIHGPAFFNSDLSLYKNFTVKEHQKIQLRLEAFNFLNHPLPQFGLQGNNDIKLNFNGPNNTASATNTNALTTGFVNFTTGRRVVEFAVKYNF
jgi:hypothetical protein